MVKPLSGKYALYGPKDTKEYVEANFIAKYGYEPPVMRWTGGGWSAGPLPVDAELAAGERQLTGLSAREEKT